MNAGPLLFTNLITPSTQRLVIPVYQRPYSWEEPECMQLWEDILAVGRHNRDKHFTGSVVWIQDGTMSATGITPLLIIDGQQRLTTLTLLLIALASYSKKHPEKELHYSYDEILESGYLINRFKKGEDRYKILLSQGDRETLCTVIDNLIDDNVQVDTSSSRLIENLDFFKSRLDAIEDQNLVWDGIQRLEVVSISLTQGQDNPQLIFESMNSTGKDLSSADLVRNFVLMGLKLEEQENLYKNHWRLIEEDLGADSYDKVFDDFIRNYLTVLYAPEPLAKRDVYPAFKRHVLNNGYDRDGRMIDLLLEMRRFAKYYSAVTADTEQDPERKRLLSNIAKLDTSTLNPLLLSFYDDFEQGAFNRDEFNELLIIVDSYVFRRAVCDCPSNAFNKYLPSIIARLNKVQDEGGNYLEAFKAFLLNEAGTSRRFPTDAEFGRALKLRDAYNFKKAFYLLSRLENSFHKKDHRDFASGNYTIEHIIPQNALAHEEWRKMLGSDYENVYEECVNNIGNLTLTAYNSELSDGTFAQKKERTSGGYNNEFITISTEVRAAEVWDGTAVESRAHHLAEQAIKVWSIPAVDSALLDKYKQDRKGKKETRVVSFRDVFNAGLIEEGAVLFRASAAHGGADESVKAIVTEKGVIRLSNGEEFNSPSLAASRSVSLLGGAGARNGWKYWTVNGQPLDVLRREFLSGSEGSVTSDVTRFRIMFWDGFYEYCSTLPDFVNVFGDTSTRAENGDCWATFGVGARGCHLETSVLTRTQTVQATVYCFPSGPYEKICDKREEINPLLEACNGEIVWDDKDAPKRTRSLLVKKNANFDAEDWEELYAWLVNSLWNLRAVIKHVTDELKD